MVVFIIKDDNFFNSENDESLQEPSFDLNSFSSGAVNKRIKSKKRKRKGKERFFKAILTVFLIGVITCSIVAGSFLIYVFSTVDGTMEEDLDDLKLNCTTTIYVKDKSSGDWKEYQRLHGMFNRIWVSYDAKAAKENKEGYNGIPQNLINAFVAIEDKRFFSHTGVDWKRTISAFGNMFLHYYSSNQGGSTITQQLVKNLTGDNSQKPSRKIREIMRARYLESRYAKDTIIECYLNTIAMGHGMYGVEVASNYYFNKHVSDLTVTECAALAAIAKSPTYYAPDDEPESNKIRRETVLREMYSQDYINKTEYENALKEKFKLVASKKVLNETETNSYFVDAIINQVTNDIAEKYGYDKTHASNNFYSGGYKIYTTLDPDIQSTVDKVFNDSKTYGIKGANGKKLQGSITVMDYEGHVLGIGGGIGKKSGNLSFNRATDAIRQPGSTMKPIAAYAPAIEQGIINYSSIVNDKATNYNGWTPKNWYLSYWGNITVQYALERSVNSIPVYLVNKLTPQVSYEFLTGNLGVTTLTKKDIDLSPLGMGGTNGGLTTLESAAAYAVFGNGGHYYKPTFYTNVCDQHDNVILSGEQDFRVAISEDTATVMNHLLRNVVYGANGTGAGARSYIPNMKVYAKTGTSNNQNDLWFVGGTPYYVASCWCGYDNQQNIPQSDIAMRMWGAVMSKVHSGLKAKKFADSPYAKKLQYCASSGMLATDGCPSKVEGWYRKGFVPGKCTWHSGKAVTQASSDSTESKDKKQNSSSLG